MDSSQYVTISSKLRSVPVLPCTEWNPGGGAVRCDMFDLVTCDLPTATLHRSSTLECSPAKTQHILNDCEQRSSRRNGARRKNPTGGRLYGAEGVFVRFATVDGEIESRAEPLPSSGCRLHELGEESGRNDAAKTTATSTTANAIAFVVRAMEKHLLSAFRNALGLEFSDVRLISRLQRRVDNFYHFGDTHDSIIVLSPTSCKGQVGHRENRFVGSQLIRVPACERGGRNHTDRSNASGGGLWLRSDRLACHIDTNRGAAVVTGHNAARGVVPILPNVTFPAVQTRNLLETGLAAVAGNERARKIIGFRPHV
eukprot:m.162193 g.162193  ORF g.162193 m.162193 type:complete len:312 (-) comp53060_c0_seq2:812-1747(-)